MPFAAFRVFAQHGNLGIEVNIRLVGFRTGIVLNAADAALARLQMTVTNSLVEASLIREYGRKNANLFGSCAEPDEMAENLTQKPTDIPVFRQLA